MLGDPIGWHKDVFIQNSPYTTHKKPSAGGEQSIRERCIVTDRWKLILNTHRKPELFDRRAALSDRENLFDKPQNKEVVRALVKPLAAWGKKTSDPQTAALIAQWSPQLGLNE